MILNARYIYINVTLLLFKVIFFIKRRNNFESEKKKKKNKSQEMIRDKVKGLLIPNFKHGNYFLLAYK